MRERISAGWKPNTKYRNAKCRNAAERIRAGQLPGHRVKAGVAGAAQTAPMEPCSDGEGSVGGGQQGRRGGGQKTKMQGSGANIGPAVPVLLIHSRNIALPYSATASATAG